MKQGTLEKIQNLAVSLQLVTVEDMRKHSLPQLVTMIANKLNELMNEVHRFETDVIEMVETQNENIQYLLGEGLHLEVATVFEGWLEDGTFDTLINQTALKQVNDRIDKTNAQLSEIKNTTIEAIEVVTNAQTDGKNTTFGHKTNKIAEDVSTSVILGGGSTNFNNVIGGDGANVNKTAPNETTTGTQAHVSVVGGYDNSAGSLSSKIISDHSKTEIGGGGHNAIYGGANHIARSTASFAMIAGGQNNEVSGYGGFVTGVRNKSAGQGSALFGCNNESRKDGGFICGAGNIIDALYGTIFGSTNLIEVGANFATALGNYAVARFVGQQVFTAGKFSKNGDAQTSVMEMHKQTNNGTGTILGVLGSNTSFKLQPNQSVAFSCLIVARDVNSTDCSSFEIKGIATRGATGNSIIVDNTVTSLGASAGASAWRISAVNGASDGGLNVHVVGEEGKTIKWVMRMTLVEVTV